MIDEPKKCRRDHEAAWPKRPPPHDCATCEGDANRAFVDRLADKIHDARARLESAHSPEEERRIVDELNRAGHPDAQGFANAVMARLRNAENRKRR